MSQDYTKIASDVVPKEPSKKTLEMVGYLNKDTFGRVYVDTCPTVEAHLKNHHGCRKYLDDLVEERLLGHRVLIVVDVFAVEHGEKNEQSKLG